MSMSSFRVPPLMSVVTAVENSASSGYIMRDSLIRTMAMSCR